MNFEMVSGFRGGSNFGGTEGPIMRAVCMRSGASGGTTDVKVTFVPEIPNQLNVEKTISPGIRVLPGMLSLW